jgi:hypothetical protein
MGIAHSSAEGSRRVRVVDVWGHYGSEALIASIFASIMVALYPPPGLAGITVPVALLGFVLASWLIMRRHDRKLCEMCMSAMPLNPAKEAERVKRRFWMAHTGSEPRFLVPYMAVIIGSSLAFSTIGRIPWAIIQSTMIYLVLSQSTHRRLQPWCPWCSDGGGGQEVETPDPVIPQDTYV